MGHNKWFVACIGCLFASLIPAGFGAMWGVALCPVFAGVCLVKWCYEEDKEQKKHRKENKIS